MKTKVARHCITAFLAAILSLMCACGGLELTSAQTESTQSPSQNANTSQPEEVLFEDDPVGIDFVRPDIAMLAMNYDNGNIIEIPQLIWPEGEQETSDGRSINERILSFSEGYEDFLDVHPGGYTCEIQTSAHFIGTYLMIVMRRSFTPSYGRDPEVTSFLYNYLLGQEDSYEDATSSILSQQEIMKTVTEAVRAEQGRAAEECKLSGYTWTSVGDIYFYDVTANNEDGEPWIYSWAYLENSLSDETSRTMSGEDAFALLKKLYPDLPPDFDKNPIDPYQAEEYLCIILDSKSDGLDGRTWNYTADGNGAVKEVDSAEYRDWKQRGIQDETDSVTLFDELVPGTYGFYFKGEKPGEVTLRFVYSDPSKPNVAPEYESICVIEIQENLDLLLVNREDSY